jgi:hypothetical protein
MLPRSYRCVPSPAALVSSTGTLHLRLFVTLFLLCLTIPAFAQVPRSRHVVIVIEENTSFSTTTSQMPWLVGEGNANGFANNFTTNSGGSLLDYLWLSSGSCHTTDSVCAPSTRPAGTNDFGCTGGGCSSVITDDNIFRELNAAGISWKLYAESLPNVGYMGGDSGEYAERHNPAKWYSDIVNSTAQQQKMVPFTQFSADLNANQLPAYSIIVPNLLDDAHDGSPAQADAWLQSNVAPLLNQSYFQAGGDGLLIITFDNGDGDVPGQVYTALIGPNVTPHTVSNVAYMHQNTLRTILDSLGVNVFPGASAGANDMSDFFSSQVAGLTISLPAGGSQVTSPVPFQATVTASNGLHITAMKVYVDSKQIAGYNGNGTSTLSVSTFYAIAGGSHLLVANAWDTSGTLYQSRVNFTAVATPSVTINAPGSGGIVTSPLPFTANVISGGAPVTAMKTYVDSQQVASYNGNGTSSLNVTDNYTVANGFHTLVANAWDSSGNLYQSATNFTSIGSSGVAINAPAAGAQVSSAMSFSTTATSAGLPITAIKVYIDSQLQTTFNGNGTSSLSANTFYSVATGPHSLVVNAWDTAGTLYQSSVNFTAVGSTGVAINAPGAGQQVASLVPFNASVTSNGLPITAMKVYLGSNLLNTYNGNGTSSLDVNAIYSITSGTHTLTANAWDTSGNLYQTAVTFTVH